MSPRPILPALAIGLALVAAACGSSTPAASATAESSTAPGVAVASPAPSAEVATPAASTGDTTAVLDCAAPASPTTSQTEGPYYRAGAPESGNLVTDGMAGTRLLLTGFVVNADCTPLANARVEIWQADSSGTYDNGVYTLRGWVVTDADGRYTFQTVVPGEYPGRTEHIHVKVTPDGGSTLTTQLYFPGTAANDADGIYSPDLLLEVIESADGVTGTFTFVVQA